MSIEGQGHLYTIYFPGFVYFVLYLAKISGERLQDHWSSGLKILKLWHFSENPQICGNLILQEKLVQNSCRQMKTVLDLRLRAMSMIGLILKNYPFPGKQNFYVKLPMVLGRTFLVSNFLYQISCSQ